MKEIKSIILYLDSMVAIEHLTDEQAGILIKGVFRYARDGQLLTSSDTALIALFSMLCNQIDRDHKKYEERCERNSANARKRYTNLSQCVQSHPNANDGVPSQANGFLNNMIIRVTIKKIMVMKMKIRVKMMMIPLTL